MLKAFWKAMVEVVSVAVLLQGIAWLFGFLGPLTTFLVNNQIIVAVVLLPTIAILTFHYHSDEFAKRLASRNLARRQRRRK